VVADEKCGMISALDEALQRLEHRNPRQGKVVELRYFGGLQDAETAELLGVTVRTVGRDWTIAEPGCPGTRKLMVSI
jgi:DNA-directed RNA polymerase specialized sigma24 family protein